MHKDFNKNGFSLIEIMVVVAIIGLLAGLIMTAFGSARIKARDAKRINDLSQIGRFLSFGCLMPDGGAGEYDLNELLAEYKSKYPQYADRMPNNIYDPKTGNETISNYKYIINDSNQCVLYANLEDGDKEITLPALSAPTSGGGQGVFQGIGIGWNGSNKYFQFSN